MNQIPELSNQGHINTKVLFNQIVQLMNNDY